MVDRDVYRGGLRAGRRHGRALYQQHPCIVGRRRDHRRIRAAHGRGGQAGHFGRHDPRDGTVVIDPYKTSYAQGEEIRLQAIPLEGHEFVGWEGAIESDKDIVTVTMSGSKLEVEAIFD
jgi:hypothetical protein